MKLAISVPDTLVKAVDRLVQRRHTPRDRLIVDALQEHVTRHGAGAVTDKLNTIYDKQDSTIDSSLLRAQFDCVEHETW